MGNKETKSPRGEKDDKKKGGLFSSKSTKEVPSKLSAEEIQNMRARRAKIAEELVCFFFYSPQSS
jgi:hypothetical protein